MAKTVGEYLGKTKPPVINQHAVSDEYRRRAGELWGDKLDRYCVGCGRLPAWCECNSGIAAWLPDLSTPEKMSEHSRALEYKLGPITLESKFDGYSEGRMEQLMRLVDEDVIAPSDVAELVKS